MGHGPDWRHLLFAACLVALVGLAVLALDLPDRPEPSVPVRAC